MLDLIRQGVIPLTWGIGNALKGRNTLFDAGRFDCDLSVTQRFSVTRMSARMASCIFPKEFIKAAVCNSVNITACICISSSVYISKIYCILKLEFVFKPGRFTLS